MARYASSGFFCITMLGLYLASPVVGLVLGEGVSRENVRGHLSSHHYVEHLRRMRAFRASVLRSNRIPRASLAALSSISPPSPSSPSTLPPPQAGSGSSRVYRVTSYGADPTGAEDSSEALLAAVADAAKDRSAKPSELIKGVTDLGGAQISLEGGKFLITRPLRFPAAGVGNLLIHGGTLVASDDFPADGFLIDLSAPHSANSSSSSSSSPSSNGEYAFEYITLRDILLDSNYRAGGISVANALRTGIDNCYVTRFASTGILVQGGHETYIRNSFLGQHITAGGDPSERNFSGTAIALNGNDNAVTDVVIFSAAIGVLVSGQANSLSGVHCYNKAAGFGGTGIYLRLPNLTQTRIVNCYLDYTGIVAEDPVQLLVADSFFLGDAFVLLRSVAGVARGVTVINNMFSGGGRGVGIVQLDESRGPFREVDQVVVDRNNVDGMSLRSTVARGSAQGNGTSWTVDFGPVLLFPDLIRHVQYSLSTQQPGVFPNHALRNVSANRVVIESKVPVPASVFVTVDQAS